MFTPEFVLGLEKPTADFLCLPMGHELFQFLEFKMSDDSSVLYHAKRPQETLSWHMGSNITTHYEFPKSMLSSDTITTQVVFAVGEKPLERLRMIERHYYGDRLLRSYDFEFGFCIPNTVNTWQATYDLPKLSRQEIDQMVADPKTVSDSFYFINDRLVLHNKSTYSYN